MPGGGHGICPGGWPPTAGFGLLQGFHPLAGEGLGEADAVAACLTHVGVVQEAIHCGGGQRLWHEFVEPGGVQVGADGDGPFLVGGIHQAVQAFGGIVGLNRPVDAATAEQLKTIFLEAVIAPGYAAEALEILGVKKNVRLLEAALPEANAKQRYDIKTVSGGMVIQSADSQDAPTIEWKTVTKRAPTITELQELELAWKVVKHVKSNAIIVARDGRTVGVGAGQMNRVGSAEIALKQAGEAAKGAVLSSDAFFPFRDTVDAAARAGITAIIQPGGSVRDEESIAAADEHGIAMIFTGMRHFKH